MDDSTQQALDAWRMVVVAHDTAMHRFASTFKKHGLTVPQYDVLLRLLRADHGQLPMGELARTLLYSSGAATKLIDRLVVLGLVERFRDPDDGRVVLVELTETGRAKALAAAREHASDVADVVGGFASAEEEHHVRAFLTRLSDTPQ